jgi:general secretion pathway protein G
MVNVDCRMLNAEGRVLNAEGRSLNAERRIQRSRLASAFAIRRSELSSGGFTLVELLIVISLISILAAMSLVQYKNSVLSTKEGVLKTDLFRMRDAIDQYYADKGKYPSALDSLVSDGYMRKVPEDPITKSADSWQTVPAEPDPNNPSGEPGIYDVKSGAQGTSLDGSSYSDW